MKYLYYSLGLLLALVPTIYFAATLKHWPTQWEVDTTQANTYLGVGNGQGAVDELQKALALHPAPEQQINLAVVLTQVGRLGEAESHLHVVLEADPNNLDAHNNLGLVLFSQGHAQEGITEFETALKIDPKNATAHMSLGAILIGQGKKEEGLEQFRKVVQDNPGSPEAYFRLASVLLQTGHAPEAVEQYQKALALAPGNPTIVEALNKARAAQGAPSH